VRGPGHVGGLRDVAFDQLDTERGEGLDLTARTYQRTHRLPPLDQQPADVRADQPRRTRHQDRVHGYPVLPARPLSASARRPRPLPSEGTPACKLYMTWVSDRSGCT